MTGYADLETKKVGETKSHSFDFVGKVPEGETIDSAVVEATTYSGEDDDPDDVIYGAADIDGTVVTQTFHHGIAGVIYGIVAEIVTSGGLRLQMSGFLGVLEDAP